MKKKLAFVIIIAVFTAICCAALQGCVRENVYSVTAEGSEFYDVALSSDKAAIILIEYKLTDSGSAIVPAS